MDGTRLGSCRFGILVTKRRPYEHKHDYNASARGQTSRANGTLTLVQRARCSSKVLSSSMPSSSPGLGVDARAAASLSAPASSPTEDCNRAACAWLDAAPPAGESSLLRLAGR